MSLSEIFEHLNEGVLWVWHYPIPWQSIGSWVGLVLVVLVAILAVYFSARPALLFVARVLDFLLDLVEVAFLLARRLKRLWFGRA
jgi:hypothetical protein